MRLSRDDILKAPGPAVEIVPVPEWGGEVAVRGMTGTERDEFELKSMRPENGQMVPEPRNLRARMVAWTVVDEDTGERLFTEDDARALGEKSAGALMRIAEVSARLSGLAEGDVKEMEDFSAGPKTTADTAPGAGSSSASPANSAKPSGSSSTRSPAAS